MRAFIQQLAFWQNYIRLHMDRKEVLKTCAWGLLEGIALFGFTYGFLKAFTGTDNKYVLFNSEWRVVYSSLLAFSL